MHNPIDGIAHTNTFVIPLMEHWILLLVRVANSFTRITERKKGCLIFFRRKEMFYLTTLSTHFIYGYMALDIWLRTILIVREETRCRHMGYSFRLAARVLLYAPSHRQDSTYHGLCYTNRGTLAGTRNSSMGPPHEGSIRRSIAPWANALTTELCFKGWDERTYFLIERYVSDSRHCGDLYPQLSTTRIIPGLDGVGINLFTPGR